MVEEDIKVVFKIKYFELESLTLDSDGMTKGTGETLSIKLSP